MGAERKRPGACTGRIDLGAPYPLEGSFAYGLQRGAPEKAGGTKPSGAI
jgi:hypothetical protein